MKKILITQFSLSDFAGSEIVTFELANYLKTQLYDVTIYTWYYADPIKTEFEKAGLNVVTDESDPALTQKFDLIWVHHQVLPINIIKNLSRFAPPMIFYHMSYKDDIFIEQPYIYSLEKLFASKSLFVSEESKALNLSKYGRIFHHADILPNFSPTAFIDSSPAHLNTNYPLQKILVVSNHTPDELSEAAEILRKQHIAVDFIGETFPNYGLVTPKLLKSYDCIISIGKTVQYCLTLGIPIYLYDIHGGCGFLTANNYQKAFHHNFSGRGFSHKTAEMIINELQANFNSAKIFQSNNHSDFIKTFSITNLNSILKTIPMQPRTKIEKTYINYIIAAESLIKQKTINEQSSRFIYKDLQAYLAINNDLTNKLTVSKQEAEALQTKIHSLESTITSMQNSRIVKLDRGARHIVNKISSILKKPNTAPTHAKTTKPVFISPLLTDDYEVEFIKSPEVINSPKIIGLIREKNESLILQDTLDEMCKITDGFIALDDNSNDESLKIITSHSECLAVIHHKVTVTGDRSMEESIHRELLLELGRLYHPSWYLYLDADERIDSPNSVREFLLDNIDNHDIDAIRFSLFDAYMTKDDHEAFSGGPLFDFRKNFGPERRDIIMAWKDNSTLSFMTKADMREPSGLVDNKIITKFFVQHYGKSMSIDQWEETCDYYINHFPQYAEKWRARKGKGIHNQLSDFGRPLETWNELKVSRGVKID